MIHILSMESFEATLLPDSVRTRVFIQGPHILPSFRDITASKQEKEEKKKGAEKRKEEKLSPVTERPLLK